MKTIFIIDDEPDITTYLTKILEQNGYDIVNATSVAQAAKFLAVQIPDLVCLDIMMPEESGISLYRQMRENPSLEKVPVIFISGVTPEGKFDIRNFIQGVTLPQPEGYLEKPIRVAEFLALVDELIARNSPDDRTEDRSRARTKQIE